MSAAGSRILSLRWDGPDPCGGHLDQPDRASERVTETGWTTFGVGQRDQPVLQMHGLKPKTVYAIGQPMGARANHPLLVGND